MIDELLLDKVDLFCGLAPPARRELAARAVLRRFASRQTLWTAGSAPRGLFVILDGRVRIVGSAGRRRRVVHAEGIGATIGEVPLFGGGGYPASAIASEATTCIVIDQQALLAAIRADPTLAWRLLARLANRVRALVERLETQTGRGVKARLVAHLLALDAAAAGRPFRLGATQTELAEELGTVREVVVRHLKTLREMGLLTTVKGRFAVRDRAALDALARRPT